MEQFFEHLDKIVKNNNNKKKNYLLQLYDQKDMTSKRICLSNLHL